jgi:hypothetical protein
VPQDALNTDPAKANIEDVYLDQQASLSLDIQNTILNEHVPIETCGPVQATEEELLNKTLKIHPNYGNHFGNLALSNSIRANGYPRHIQDAQIRNIFVPNWAVTSLNTEPDPGEMKNAFGDIYKRATSLLEKGETVNRIIGDHPNIAALYDPEQFDRSCILSQWAARMVHSVKCQGKHRAFRRISTDTDTLFRV